MKGARWLVHDGASLAGRQICITASVADQSASFEPSIVAAISAGTPTARATSAQAKASIMTIPCYCREARRFAWGRSMPDTRL
jgi:hypothetical protein